MTEVIGIDHIYIAVSDLARSEIFYDRVLLDALGFRKNKFILGGDPHVQYFNRHFGYVLRPARALSLHDSYAPGLHHLCLRVDTVAGVTTVSTQLRNSGIEASEAKLDPELNVVQEGIPEVIPAEMCYLGWQESLALLAMLVEPEISG